MIFSLKEKKLGFILKKNVKKFGFYQIRYLNLLKNYQLKQKKTMKKNLFMTLMFTLSFSVIFAQGVHLRQNQASKTNTDVSVDRAPYKIEAPIPAVPSTNADKSILLHNNGSIVSHPEIGRASCRVRV